MKMHRFVKAAISVGIVAVCSGAMVACSNSASSSSNQAVAATVNGTPIYEQTVTDQIEQIRSQAGLADEATWGEFLVSNDMTPASVREQIIDSLKQQELIKQGAAELGVSVDSSEVDEYVNTMKANYDSDDAWNTALKGAGFTEESYRKVIEESLLEQKVSEHFEEAAQLTDEDYVKAAQTYASYYDGAKRSSHILFKVDDTSDEAAMAEARAKAEEVLAQINSGSLDFAEAAKQYSDDTGSAAQGGDVGWDILNSFATEYTDAVSGLELNQVSGLVTSEYGIHIIKVTEVYNAPENPEDITSLDQIPEAFRETIKSMAASIKANDDYTAWLEDLESKANIVINDMPSGLPYDIDLTPYQQSSSTEATDSSASSSESSSASESSSTSESSSSSSAAA